MNKVILILSKYMYLKKISKYYPFTVLKVIHDVKHFGRQKWDCEETYRLKGNN